METDISNIDNVSLARIFLECSDRTITYLMLSIKQDEVQRILEIISKERKIAIQSEIKLLESVPYLNIEEEVEIFFKNLRLLESQGEIIISPHTANCV